MKYPIFDGHCDTVYETYIQDKVLAKNNLQLDLKRLNENKEAVQVFAAFVDKKNITVSPMKHVLRLINHYYDETEKNADILKHCNSYREIRDALSSGKVASVLSIEGGEALEGELSALFMFYKLGVRLITLTWNYANEIADGICEPRGGGLTEFGREVVKEMNRLKMVVDVSHLSEKGFWDVAEISEAPFIASHSCVKKLCNHPRNLTDEQIKAIINIGGCIGVNFYPEFLTEGKVCTSEDIIRHIDYICNLGGIYNVGFGSDFDGVESLPTDIKGAEDIYIIINKLFEAGYSQNNVKSIAFHNFMRVFSQIL